uniref:SFRICE_007973 n=1 Tax=Spodoptera frugiperda TaxID=7108 RepID=A0A2H1VNB7_SPOFR
MDKTESIGRSSIEGCMNIDLMRSLVKQYSELGQWTSALFWADAAAAAAGGGLDSASGDDVWLLASAMLARGELHRAAHAVTSRGLHRRHLLCLGVAMRAFLAAREPATALNLMDECDPMLLEPRNTDQTHNRALAGVLVWQARALTALERREAAAEALAAALRADCAHYEALDLLLEQHALTPHQESELIESLPINSQLSAAEGALLRAAYRQRLHRYSPAPIALPPPDTDCPITAEAEAVGGRMMEAAQSRARRLAAACRWTDALRALDTVDPWCCVEVRAACLVELKRSSELFAFAHSLVDAYPHAWTSWYAVGCYYYLIGKSELARRYLSKAKSLEPSAGCVWLAYGHSFAADNEHDQAMAAYFKASQLMSGCHLPPLYVGVECALLNNFTMCERFLTRAASLHSNAKVKVSKLTCHVQPKLGGYGQARREWPSSEIMAKLGDYGQTQRLWPNSEIMAKLGDYGQARRLWPSSEIMAKLGENG